MEYQAGWVSGALLMPATALREWAAEVAARFNAKLPFPMLSKPGGQLIYRLPSVATCRNWQRESVC